MPISRVTGLQYRTGITYTGNKQSKSNPVRDGPTPLFSDPAFSALPVAHLPPNISPKRFP